MRAVRPQDKCNNVFGMGSADDGKEKEEGEEEQIVQGDGPGLGVPAEKCGIKPNLEEVASHEISHFPFRNWCKHCVVGRAENNPHKMIDRQDTGKPIISWDYMYSKEKDSGPRKAVVEGEGLPIVVAVDSNRKAVIANVVPNKGVNDLSVAHLTGIVASAGEAVVNLKSDQEPAIQKLKESVSAAARLQHGITVHSTEGAAYSSNTNAHAESAVRQMRGMARTLAHELKEKTGS